MERHKGSDGLEFIFHRGGAEAQSQRKGCVLSLRPLRLRGEKSYYYLPRSLKNHTALTTPYTNRRNMGNAFQQKEGVDNLAA
jgi:hypothetical protein